MESIVLFIHRQFFFKIQLKHGKHNREKVISFETLSQLLNSMLKLKQFSVKNKKQVKR